jgi:predicted MFS family arabinose efflux permease
LPLLTRFTFHRGPGAYGAMFSVMGAGAVLGGLAIAARRASRKLLIGSTLAFGMAVVGVAASPTLGVAMAIMIPVGAASTGFIASSSSLLQLGSSPEMRGRVMALFSIVFLGSTPVGGPLVGWIAERFGPRTSLGLAGVATLVAGLIAAYPYRPWHQREAAPVPG